MTSDLSGWRRGTGLGHHAETLRINGVDFDVSDTLTEADLKELGLSLGDRRRLLQAIAARGDAPAAGPRAASPIVASETPAAERRQLTAMFVDLAGSTALSARLDPEDMREIIRLYRNTVAGEIARFEGYVAKFMGDGALWRAFQRSARALRRN